jgi:hypothetical protein
MWRERFAAHFKIFRFTTRGFERCLRSGLVRWRNLSIPQRQSAATASVS